MPHIVRFRFLLLLRVVAPYLLILKGVCLCLFIFLMKNAANMVQNVLRVRLGVSTVLLR